MAINIRIYLFYLPVVMLFIGCRNQEDGISSPATNNTLYTVYTDTLTVEMSTVMIDSVITSTTGRLISGAYTDPGIGKVSAAPFFQLSLSLIDNDEDGHEDIISPSAVDPIYDSLVLVMPYQYSYGDTTQSQEFSIHRVNEDILYNSISGYLYNSSSFSYDAVPLATYSFKPARDMNTHIRIKLSNTFGNELFSLALSEDGQVANNTNFRNYFKGLVIKAGAGSNNFIAGFSTSPTMVLYYHEAETPGTVKSYTFKHASEDKHFNQILNDRTGTDLSSLTDSYQEVSSSAASNRAYFLTGIALMTKFRIPYLHELRNIYPNFIISKAYLVISPENNTYSPQFPLPKALQLYIADQYNLPLSVNQQDNYTSVQYVDPTIDYETQENTNYKFELTKFLQEEIGFPSDSRRCLLLSSDSYASASKAEKMTIAVTNSQRQGAKLILYLTVK